MTHRRHKQNQLPHTLSIELRRTHPQVTCVLLHPGTVDTLSKPFQLDVPAEKLFGAQHATQQLLAVIASITPSRSGSCVAWNGETIPW